MINYCADCAHIRQMPLQAVQRAVICDLCGKRAMCSQTHISGLKTSVIAFEAGLFSSYDLSKSLALVKSRKASIAPRIIDLETDMSKLMISVRYQEAIELLSQLLLEAQTKKNVNTLKAVIGKMQIVVDDAVLHDDQRNTKGLIKRNLLSELKGLNEKEKELSVLYHRCIEEILITELRITVGNEAFDKVFARARKIYAQRNGKS